MKMNVIVLLARAGYPPKIRDEVFKEILDRLKVSNGTVGLALMLLTMILIHQWWQDRKYETKINTERLN